MVGIIAEGKEQAFNGEFKWQSEFVAWRQN